MNLLRQFAIATVVVLVAILVTWGHAANVPTLVRDINQMPIGVSSNTIFLGTIGSLTFFAADDGVHGSELWKTDGTTAGTSLVKDINPGSAASNPANFLVVGNVGYFSATTAASGQEVWVTDGTNTGTRLVADIAPGPLSSGAFPAGALGSKILIYAITNNSPHLYASDGTPSGTVALAATDLYQRPTAGLLVTATNGKAYFEAYADPNNETPFVTDGTVGGTHSLGTTSGGNTLVGGGGFTQAGAYVYFGAATAGTGQLFRARLADNVVEQITSNTAPQDFGIANDRGFIVAAGNLVYFIGSTAGVTQVWRSDGTSGGTFALSPFNAMAGNSPVSPHLTIANDHLFFISASGSPGFTAAFASDGTVAGTINLTDQLNVRPSIMGSDGNYAYFGPAPLVRSDGTASGTHVITNLGGLQIQSDNRATFSADTHSVYFGVIGDWPGDSTRISYATFKYDPASDTSVVVRRAANPPGDLFALSADRLYFSGLDPTTGDEPWVSDGTAAGTLLLADIAPEPTQAGSNPDNFYTFQGKVYFSANDGIAGNELWKSDGTLAGTLLAADLVPGIGDSAPTMLFGANNALMMFAYNSQVATKFLWRYDPVTGVAANFPTVSTPYTCLGATAPATVGSTTYFAAFGQAVDLWRTDGTVANTLEIQPAANGYSFSQPCNLVAFGNAVYFLAQDAAGYGLWTSDGTSVGTAKVASLGAFATTPAPRFLISFAGQLFFFAADTNNQLAMYGSDGTTSHTSIVSALPAILNAQLGIVHNRLVFGSSGYVGNVGLWVFDATTTAFTAIPGVRFVSSGTLAENGALAFFTGSDTSHLGGAWVTDGTATGTKALVDASGNYPNPVSWLGDFHSEAIYTDIDPSNGVGRYWKSDGTVAGTSVIAEMSAGQSVSSTSPAGATAGNKFYFAVSDPVIGSELYALAQDTIPTATTLTISPSSAAVGAPIGMTAAVSQTSGNVVPTGSVRFMEGGSTLGTGTLDANGAAALTTSILPVGQHAFTAVYSGDSVNSSSISPVAQVTVVNAPSVSLNVKPSAITLGQSATLAWSTSNATQCTASNAWAGNQPISGSTVVTPASTGTVSYALSCTNSGVSANATATLMVNATATPSSGHGGGGQLTFAELLTLLVLVVASRFGYPSTTKAFRFIAPVRPKLTLL